MRLSCHVLFFPPWMLSDSGLVWNVFLVAAYACGSPSISELVIKNHF